jgi:hypothetical protein
MIDTQDLLVVVADSDQQFAIRTLLEKRSKALGLKDLRVSVERHSGRDPGVYNTGVALLGSFGFPDRFKFAMLVIDTEWEDSPGLQGIETRILRDLKTRGWEEKSAVIAIEPEIEAWVWQDSPHIPRVLGRKDSFDDMRQSLKDLWPLELSKPKDPKTVFDRARGRLPRSPALFAQLAEKVSVQRCTDPSFLKFRDQLQIWFSI